MVVTLLLLLPVLRNTSNDLSYALFLNILPVMDSAWLFCVMVFSDPSLMYSLLGLDVKTLRLSLFRNTIVYSELSVCVQGRVSPRLLQLG